MTKNTTNRPPGDESPVEKIILYLRDVPSRYEGQGLDAPECYRKQADILEGFALQSEAAAAPYSPGSEQRLHHIEQAAATRIKSRACLLIADGQSIAAAVSTVLRLPQANVQAHDRGASGASAQNKEDKASPKKRAGRASSRPAPATESQSPQPTGSDAPPDSSSGSGSNDERPSAMSNTSDTADAGTSSRKSSARGSRAQASDPDAPFGKGVYRKTPRSQVERMVAQEAADQGGARYYKVCEPPHEYDGLYGREVARIADGWTVTLEIPTPGGEWVEEMFDRSVLIPSARELFERAASVCDGEASPSGTEAKAEAAAPAPDKGAAIEQIGRCESLEELEPFREMVQGHVFKGGDHFDVNQAFSARVKLLAARIPAERDHEAFVAELLACETVEAVDAFSKRHDIAFTSTNPRFAHWTVDLRRRLSKATEERRKKLAPMKESKRDHVHWLTKANAMLALSAERRKNPAEGKKLTPARRRDWQYRLDDATGKRRLGLTMEKIAEAVGAAKLPGRLCGLTNEYQVRTIMNCVVEGRTMPRDGMPQNMGPTIKSRGDFEEAVEALRWLVPDVKPYTVAGELNERELPPGGLPIVTDDLVEDFGADNADLFEDATSPPSVNELLEEHEQITEQVRTLAPYMSDARAEVEAFHLQHHADVDETVCPDCDHEEHAPGGCQHGNGSWKCPCGVPAAKPKSGAKKKASRAARAPKGGTVKELVPLVEACETGGELDALIRERDALAPRSRHGDRTLIAAAILRKRLQTEQGVEAGGGNLPPFHKLVIVSRELRGSECGPKPPGVLTAHVDVGVGINTPLMGCEPFFFEGRYFVGHGLGWGNGDASVYVFECIPVAHWEGDLYELEGWRGLDSEQKRDPNNAVAMLDPSGRAWAMRGLAHTFRSYNDDAVPERHPAIVPGRFYEAGDVYVHESALEASRLKRDPSADPRKCPSCEVIYDTNDPAQAEAHQHPDNEQTEKGRSIVRQLVKCETTAALEAALSRYRLDELESVEGLTTADRKQLTYCIGIRRQRIAENEAAPVEETPPPASATTNGRCAECGYKLPGHRLNCKTGQRAEATVKKQQGQAA
jgi:hypothetical protein